MGKQKLPPPGLGLNAHARTEPAGLGRAAVGSLLSAPERPLLPPRLHVLLGGPSSARVRKPSPAPRPLAPRLRPARRGQPRPRAPGARGQEPARTRPARPVLPPRIPQIPAGGAWARVGAQRAEACRGSATAGGAGGGCSHCPPVHSPRGLLPRKTPRSQSSGDWGSRENPGGLEFSRRGVPSPSETH